MEQIKQGIHEGKIDTHPVLELHWIDRLEGGEVHGRQNFLAKTLLEKTRVTPELSDPKHDANWPASCEGQGSHPMECPSAPKSAADSLLIVGRL